MAKGYKVLEVARLVTDEVNRLLGDRRYQLIHRAQLRDSAQSTPANIREGLGRDPGPDRNKSYRTARGSAEETDEHLRANYSDGRIPREIFRPLHNRLALITKMLDEFMT